MSTLKMLNRMYMISATLITLLLLGVTCTQAQSPDASTVEDADLTGLHLVARDNCGIGNQQDHLLAGSNYRYPEADIPVGIVGAEEPARTVVHGESVQFEFHGLDKKADYKLRVVYLSDSDDRVQRMAVDKRVLQDRVELPKSLVVTHRQVLPKETYEDGVVTLEFSRIDGPNAVVSLIEIWSTNPKRLTSIYDWADLFEIPTLTPRPVSLGQATASTRVDLNGLWRFNPAPKETFWQESAPSDTGWSDIEVPGEWVMQGFTVEKETAAGYFRTFEVPPNWSGHRVKLRCDAVYSLARVWINGQEAGRHEGGFTPFEFDVTDMIQAGQENTVALTVQNESLTDVLASGTQYAVHQLGGITRNIYLFAVPELNVSSLHVETSFDRDYDNATLRVLLEIVNESKEDVNNAQVEFKLREWPDVKRIDIDHDTVKLPIIKAGETHKQVVEINVPSPKKWDCEHPNLHVLGCNLSVNGESLETIVQRFGFRQVEVRGDQLFVNNHPVKLHGVNRHETHPLRGRSLTPEIWRKDAELFRAANCNYIRTSHYPPAEEFIELCDELGLFVEEEAPLCWVGHGANDIWRKWSPHAATYLQTIVRAAQEMIQRDRSHPSVIIWSLANESAWGPSFRTSFEAANRADPTRPKSFHDQSWGGYNENGSNTQIANQHYPGPGGAAQAAKTERPLLFGEYCHLNAYNRHELATDPGVRDMWGRGFTVMWDQMYAAQGLLGGALWSGVDDTFFLPDGKVVGYGAWGPIDGWRRPKPEYWHMKKVYSPVRILTKQISASKSDELIRIELENRHDFTNINELRIEWAMGNASGIATGNIPPRSQGEIVIPITAADHEGGLLAITFFSPRGFMIDSALLPMGSIEPSQPDVIKIASGKLTLHQDRNDIIVDGNGFQYALDAKTGMLAKVRIGNHTVLTGGPHLMLLALNGAGGTQMTGNDAYEPDTNTCSNWQATEVTATENDDCVEIKVKGNYEQATGFYVLKIGPSGQLTVNYEFTVAAEINPRQVGMVLDLPSGLDNLTWHGKTPWTTYPMDHIGRPYGQTKAFVHKESVGYAGPRSQPDHPWAHDGNALGANDFRSTKENIYWATLTGDEGTGILIRSDAEQSIRAWVEDKNIRVLVADYANPGAERFFRGHAAKEDKPLGKGDSIKGRIILELINL